MDLVLNKNFYNYIGCILFGGVWRTSSGEAEIGTAYSQGLGYSGAGYASTPRCTLVDTSGASKNGVYFSVSNSSPNAGGWNHSFFYFRYANNLLDVHFTAGSGAVAATVNDTALETPNSDITATIETGRRDTATSIAYTVTFSATTEQTLSEIGLERAIPTANNVNSTILFGRCVLDEPITLDANTSKTVQIRLALPTLE